MLVLVLFILPDYHQESILIHLVVPSTPLESSSAAAYKRVVANWTSFGSRSLIGNLGKSRVFDHEVERTVATLIVVCENSACAFLLISQAS
jgi:hypothetical protein